MIKIMINEVNKMLSQKKTYVFIGIIILVSFINLTLAVVTKSYFDSSSYGQTFPLVLFDSISTLFLPVFVILYVVTLVTDEYVDGSLKLPLLRKVSRNQLLLGKICSLAVILLIFMLVQLILGYSFGMMFFGWGEGFFIKGKSYSSAAGISITVVTYIISLLSNVSFGTIILLFALLINNSASVAGIGIGVLFSSLLVDYMIPAAAPYMISSYFNSYRLLVEGITLEKFMIMLLVIVGYGLLFYGLSLIIFKKKDILN